MISTRAGAYTVYCVRLTLKRKVRPTATASVPVRLYGFTADIVYSIEYAEDAACELVKVSFSRHPGTIGTPHSSLHTGRASLRISPYNGFTIT